MTGEEIVPIGEYVFDEPDVDMDAEAYAFDSERVLDRAADVLAVPQVEHKPRWHVTDTGRADWAMSRLADAQDRLAQRRAEHRQFVERANEWLKDASAQDERRVRWLTWELEQFGIAARTAQSKTIKLVSGAIATRESKPQAVVEDQAAFVDWYEEHGGTDWPTGMVTSERVYKVNLTELRRHVAPVRFEDGWRIIDPETGEIIPGLGVSEGKITATVEPA